MTRNFKIDNDMVATTVISWQKVPGLSVFCYLHNPKTYMFGSNGDLKLQISECKYTI